jgi:uncharacterized SAM-binding protein YcdF (DUF218 family)
VVKRWKRLLLAFVATLILIGALVAWWVNTHTPAISRYLEVSQPPEKADFILVPSGGDAPRLAKAAELYADGYAPKILLAGFGKSDPGIESFRKKYKIPSTALVIEPDATNTYTNATRSAPLLRKSGARTVILVTSWWHSRRALNMFRHVMPDVRFISVPTRRASWPVSRETLTIEFWKLGYYGVAYRVLPW